MEEKIFRKKSCLNCEFLGVDPKRKGKKFFCLRNEKMQYQSLCYHWELNFAVASESEIADEMKRIKEKILQEYGEFELPSFEEFMARIDSEGDDFLS